MFSYIFGRACQALFVLWLAYTLTFAGVALLPSDPITIHLAEISGGNGNIDPNMVAAMKAYYGFDQPLHRQYLHQFVELLHGDFGYSLTASLPVLQRIGQVIGPTLNLSGLAFVFALLVAGALATIGALARRRAVRGIVRGLPALFSSVPSFWLGIMALQLFSIQLHWMSIFPDGSAIGLVVPAAVLAIPLSAGLTQVLLTSIDGVYAQPYIDVARAKGARPARVFFRHVLKNAVGPAITVAGLMLGHLVTGAVVIETVFARPGLGRVLQQAVSTQDIALIQGFVLLAAVAFVTINLLVDLIYPLLDPRIVLVHRSSFSLGRLFRLAPLVRSHADREELASRSSGRNS